MGFKSDHIQVDSSINIDGSIYQWNSLFVAGAGAQGIQGIQGIEGRQGTTGSQGAQGIQGTTGIQGIQGRQGTQGLQGIQGTQGITGSQGSQGTQGIQGVQGIQGIKGEGNAAVQGITGAYTVAALNANNLIDASGTFSINLPNGLDTGFQTTIINSGPGVITITASTTLLTSDASVALRKRYSAASVIHKGSNIWYGLGSLE